MASLVLSSRHRRLRHKYLRDIMIIEMGMHQVLARRVRRRALYLQPMLPTSLRCWQQTVRDSSLEIFWQMTTRITVQRVTRHRSNRDDCRNNSRKSKSLPLWISHLRENKRSIRKLVTLYYKNKEQVVLKRSRVSSV